MSQNSMKLLAAVLISGASLGLAGCHTASGFGEDVSEGYHAVTGSSSSNSTSSTSSNATTPSTQTATGQAASSQAAGSTTSQSASTTTPTPKPAATSGSTGPAKLSRASVRQAQTKLHADGYYDGKIDGLVGPKTRSAVMAYQKKEGKTATGQLDTTTLNDLTGKM